MSWLLALKRSVPLLLISTPDVPVNAGAAPVFFSSRVPPSMIVGPVKLLLFVSVCVPEPVLVSAIVPVFVIEPA